jgi:hypothetical protein
MLSTKALGVLEQLFAENSNLQLPVGVAKEAIEIREWIMQEKAKPSEASVSDEAKV